MIALLTACLFFEILVHMLNCIRKSATKTVFGHLKCEIWISCIKHKKYSLHISQFIIHQIFSLACNLSKHIHMTLYSPTKTAEFLRKFANFQNCACCKKYLKDKKHHNLHLGRKYATIFVLGQYLFLKAYSFSHNIMSTDKYPSIFSHQMEAIVSVI